MLISSARSYTQNYFTSFFAGASNYHGDLDKKIYSPKHTGFAWGIGLLFELNDNVLLRGDFTNARIGASDADGTSNRSRNLSFTSNITEFALGAEYLPINLYYYKVSPYFFAQLALFRFSPHAKNVNGDKFSLWELSTEGEGFYKDRKRYKLTQLSIPFGAGFQWAMGDNTRLGFVIGIRKTFTDYLDDVSKTYVDEDLLNTKRGPLAVTYAYRGDELSNGDPYPTDGTKRGNPADRDLYYFSGISLRVRLPAIHSRRKSSYRVQKSRVTCPKPF